MLFDPNYTQYLFDEHERRVRALQLEHAALAARTARANAMAQLVGWCFGLVARLVMMVWRGGWSLLHRTRWILPSLNKPYG